MDGVAGNGRRRIDESIEANAWAAVVGDRACATWRLWSAGIDRATSLTDRGREVLHQAAGVIARFFGPDWLARSIEVGGCPLISPGSWPNMDVRHVYASVLEFALRLDVVSGATGVRALRRLAEPRPGWEQWRHFVTQLRLGSGAMAQGWGVEFEPALADGKSADLRFFIRGSTVDIEVVHLRLPDAFLNADALAIAVQHRLHQIETRYGVHIQASLGELSPGEVPGVEINRWLTDVDACAADAAVSSGGAVVHGPRGCRARIASDAFPPGTSIMSGPATRFNAMERVCGAIVRKSRQMRSSHGAWIVVDDGSGLWQFDPWRDLSPDARLVVFTTTIARLELSPSIRGVIMSHEGRHLGQRESSLVVGLSACTTRVLPTGRVRESLITTRGKSTGLADMFRLHDAEATFLDNAVRRRFFLRLSEIFATR